MYRYYEILDHYSGMVDCYNGLVWRYKVSPPQMPVLLKRMYNADILRVEITTFVPSYPPM